MKKTLKYLLGDLSDYLDEYRYFDTLASLKEANLSTDELKKKLQRLVAEAETADKKYTAGRILVHYWAEVNSWMPDESCLNYEFRDTMNEVNEELGLEGVDIDEDEWDNLEEYFNNLEIEESNLDILHDRIETVIQDADIAKSLLKEFDKIEDLKIREEKMEGCVTVLEEAKHKYDSVVKEADDAFRSVRLDIEEKLNKYIEQN